MNYPVIDLTNCDKEPIHILGKVQSHACLVAVDRNDFTIVYVSRNLETLTGQSYDNFLNHKLELFFASLGQEDNGESVLQVVKFVLKNDPGSLNPIRLNIGGHVFNMIVHVSGNYLVLEFEPSSSTIDGELQQYVGSSLSKILEGRTLQDTLESAATQIKELIGYDRVMVYRFWEDGHGEVVAEKKNDGLEPFFGLHYPASDIPKQARELYKVNLTRIIADVKSEPSDIVSYNDLTKGEPLDLTNAGSRAVSSIHIQYLLNMGVEASFSVSLIANDELWGLIACHNYEPRFIDYKARQHAKLIGQVLSSSIQYRNNKEDKEININYRNVADDLIRKMHQDWSVTQALINPKNSVLGITSASGVAVVFEGRTHLIGQTPSVEQVSGLVNWLQAEVKQNVFHTSHLGDHYPHASSLSDAGSGLLACSISRELGEYLLFFKPEFVSTVNWAGNPEKPVEIGEDGISKLSPRRSFAIWSREIRGHSEPWTRTELNSVYKFREDLVHFINLKANEIRKLNERLKEAYDELDTFSFTISHDLKTPIASIKNYSEILLEDNPGINEQGRHFLTRIMKSADKMNNLIREVMGYSRVSRQALNKQRIGMAVLLEELKTELIAAYQPGNLQFTILGTPEIKGDKVMISQVFTNLLGNAIKYSSKSNPSIVKVEGKEEGGQVVYSISDNGIGIDMNFGGHIFELFKRMDNVRDYEGSGVGLAIVKRIMEKHNAKIWYESEPGNGTIFYLSFQRD
ncbi:MAG: GAF domain-containing protein [Chitinophagaceae bacterium]|nr:MAG: GAF domain-containing protein [Chitinophagaceae bacterium]